MVFSSMTVLVAFVAVNLILLKEFSFQKTIDGVLPQHRNHAA